MANINSDFLSKDSFELLKYFSKVTSITPPESNKLPEECVSQLLTAGLIDCSAQTINIDTMFSEFTYTITENGKGYLRHLKMEARKKWIPYIITTTISVLSLMKSYGHGIEDIILWCMKQLMQQPK